MICPRCDVDMRKMEVSEVEIDVCDQCKGMFLEKGELNKVAQETVGDLEYCTIENEDFDHPDKKPVIDCPSCQNVHMKKAEFIIHSDIILDYCGHCHGFWLDGKEYVRINEEIKHLNENAEEHPNQPMLWLADFLWRLPF